MLWRIKPKGVADYLFNIRIEGTVKAVAESAMREVVGRPTSSDPHRRPYHQRGRGAGTDAGARQLRFGHPQRCKCKVSAAQVIDCSATCVAARADLERLQNEAQTYANRVVPDARGRAAQILRSPRLQAAGGRRGQGAERAFPKVYDEYKKAPDVTRQRIYLKRWSVHSGSAEKLVYDGGGSASSQSIAVPAY